MTDSQNKRKSDRVGNLDGWPAYNVPSIERQSCTSYRKIPVTVRFEPADRNGLGENTGGGNAPSSLCAIRSGSRFRFKVC